MTREQFLEWNSNPTTQIIKKLFTKERAIQCEQAAQSGISKNMEEIALAVARHCGYIMGITEFVDMDWESLHAMLDEHKMTVEDEDDA